jgi:release factor glutamine methyltransferase
MTNSKELFQDLVNRVTLSDDPAEIHSMIYLLLEKVHGLSRSQIMSEKKIDRVEKQTLMEAIARLNRHEPIQYILGEASFYGRLFCVNSSVLIPRPETELLVAQIAAFIKKSGIKNPKIVDLGTGSGCIAITLSLEIKEARVTATDVSAQAIQCAKQNAHSLNASVEFIVSDVLHDDLPGSAYDVIVSNPPYIPEEEKKTMNDNVLNYEPHLALFPPAENPLLFYEVIAQKSKQRLKPGGLLAVEINARFGQAVKNIFETSGLRDVTIVLDLDGKDRVVTSRL